jgi:hypothetical protein
VAVDSRSIADRECMVSAKFAHGTPGASVNAISDLPSESRQSHSLMASASSPSHRVTHRSGKEPADQLIHDLVDPDGGGFAGYLDCSSIPKVVRSRTVALNRVY